MPVPKRRTSTSKKNKRRAHDAQVWHAQVAMAARFQARHPMLQHALRAGIDAAEAEVLKDVAGIHRVRFAFAADGREVHEVANHVAACALAHVNIEPAIKADVAAAEVEFHFASGFRRL